MSRMLALEWNETEARLVVGSVRGEGAVIEQAFSVALGSGPVNRQPAEDGSGEPVTPPQPEGAAPTATDVGKKIAAALAARGIRRIETVVAIGRASIELRQLTLPPVPDEELPEVVRFQALREFNALQEDWPLDFIPIDEDPSQPRSVLAAAIAADLVGQIQATCQTAGVKLRRLILRPCGAASLFCRRQAEGLPRARLLVDLVADEADLTVIIDRKVIFLRTARLPGDPLGDRESAQALLGEIRRTVAAVHNQLAGRRVESIALCGTGPQHAALGEQIAERLGTPAELFDPFAGLRLESPLERQLPEHPARFAPLLGMLVDELEQVRHAVDFLHPRRKPEPPNRIKQYLLAGLGAAAVVAGVFAYGWLESGRLDREIELTKEELTTWEAEAGQAAKIRKAADDIQAWQSGDTVWLDEFRWLSDKLPPAEDAMLTQFQAGASPKGGEMKFEGLARSLDAIKAMEQNLRDGTHRLIGKDAGESAAKKGYTLRFSSSVYVNPEQRR